jgi:hypothetical protein
MATTTTSRVTNTIEKEFDSFYIDYDSLDLNVPNPRNTGTESRASIVCYNKNDLAGVINFYDHQPPPVNSHIGSRHPHININFHISRFDDMINILRNQRSLSIWFDFDSLDGGLTTGVEPIGRQE